MKTYGPRYGWWIKKGIIKNKKKPIHNAPTVLLLGCKWVQHIIYIRRDATQKEECSSIIIKKIAELFKPNGPKKQYIAIACRRCTFVELGFVHKSTVEIDKGTCTSRPFGNCIMPCISFKAGIGAFSI
jgi:hypothetical protein